MTLRSVLFAASCLALGLAVGGCPKRPVVPAAQAPAPTASAPVPPPAPPAPAPVTPAPVTPAPVAPAPAPAPPPAAATPVAPAPAPAPPRVPAREYQPHPTLKDIYFDFDREAIRPRDARILDATAEWLKANGKQLAVIEGHCDDRGTSEYNMALGERRARAAADYLRSKGIDGGRLLLISYGKERPLCEDRTDACRAANRRAAFLVKEQ